MLTVKIAHASKDENGKFQGGAPGDQSQLEVCIRGWYKRPWNVVIRPKTTTVANKIAEAMERAAKNDHWGYNQLKRNSGLIEARKVGYDPGRVTKDVNTDCSALVTVACIYAGVKESALFRNNNSATTRTLRKWLLETGMFQEFTATSFTDSPNLLERGDILLSEGHHVAVVVSTTAAPSTKSNPLTKSITDIAKEVIKGKWGNDPQRSIDLRAAGYDPEAVRAEVNRLMR